MSLTANERAIMHDYDQAFAHAQKYVVPFLIQVNARGLMIESACRKFAAFLDLPPTNSRIMPFLNFAWEAVSTAVPALKIAKTVETALSAKLMAERSAAIVLPAAGRVGTVIEGAGKVKDAGEKVVGMVEKGKEAISPDAIDGFEAIEKLDKAKAPIKELIEDARAMVKLYGDTLDFLVTAKEFRLSMPDVKYNGSLLGYAQKRLPQVAVFTGDELDQLETAHLWEMIASWARQNVSISDTFKYEIHGMNNTQQATIMRLFSWEAKRGRIFYRPAVPSLISYLLQMGVPVRKGTLKPIDRNDPVYKNANRGHGRLRT